MHAKPLIQTSVHHSPTVASIVPHFSSTMAPPVLSSLLSVALPNETTNESIASRARASGDNLQALMDQLRSCIATLADLIQDRLVAKKHSSTSFKFHRKETRRSRNNQPARRATANNLALEDIAVQRCSPPSDSPRRNGTMFIFSLKPNPTFQRINLTRLTSSTIITIRWSDVYSFTAEIGSFRIMRKHCLFALILTQIVNNEKDFPVALLTLMDQRARRHRRCVLGAIWR